MKTRLDNKTPGVNKETPWVHDDDAPGVINNDDDDAKPTEVNDEQV